jgi:TolB protein
MTVIPGGSIYGAAFSQDGTHAALAIAAERTVAIFSGPSQPLRLTRASTTEMALSPDFSPTGKLAHVGINGNFHRIYVDGRALSPPGLMASAPAFCAHPNGTRLIYTVRSGRKFDLVVSDDNGRNLRRLTGGAGSNTCPACSPDGRLVAFFSTRTSHEGPGLYIMPIDRGRPQRISSFVGSSLVWARLPGS